MDAETSNAQHRQLRTKDAPRDTVAWYVLRTKPRKENQAYNYLSCRGIVTYYPVIHVKPVNPRSSTVRPYFPGYLFILTSLEDVAWSTLQWLPGAVGVVEFGGIPATVPDSFIHELKCRIEAAQRIDRFTTVDFQQGDVVRIVDGPLAGYQGIFDSSLSGCERVRILLQCLGHLNKVEINPRVIEKAGCPASFYQTEITARELG